MPAGGQWSGFGFAVADDTGDHQIGVVERRAEGMHQRVPEFAPLMDGPGGLGRDMAGNTARKGELPKQPAQSVGVFLDAGVDLAVGAFEVGVGDQAWAAVPGAGDVDDLGVAGTDDPIQMGVDEVESRRGAPVSQEPGFDVLGAERFGQ